MPHPVVPRSRARRARILLLTGAALLAPASSAGADPPWTPPATAFSAPVDEEIGLSGTLDVLQGTGGPFLVRQGATRLRAFRTDGRAVRTRRVPGLVDSEAWGDRAVHLLDRRGRVTVHVGDLAARALGRPRVVPGARSADGLVVGPRGDVLVIESRDVATADEDGLGDDGSARVVLHARARGTATRWRSATLPGRARLLAAAVDARGEATILAQRTQDDGRRRIVGRVLTLRTGRPGPERTLQQSGYDLVDGTVAVDARGGAVLAWGGQDGGEEPDEPYVVRGTFRRRGTTAFARARTLDPGGTETRAWRPPVAAMDGAGRATVGWTAPVGGSTGFADGPQAPRVAVGTVRDAFGRTTTLLPTGAIRSVVAAGPTTAVSYSGSPLPLDPEADTAPARTVLGVAVRAGSGALGVPERAGSVGPGDAPTPRLVGAGHVIRALWDGPRDGRNVPLRTSVRGAAGG